MTGEVDLKYEMEDAQMNSEPLESSRPQPKASRSFRAEQERSFVEGYEQDPRSEQRFYQNPRPPRKSFERVDPLIEAGKEAFQAYDVAIGKVADAMAYCDGVFSSEEKEAAVKNL
jgi:hypothetical protein